MLLLYLQIVWLGVISQTAVGDQGKSVPGGACSDLPPLIQSVGVYVLRGKTLCVTSWLCNLLLVPNYLEMWITSIITFTQEIVVLHLPNHFYNLRGQWTVYLFRHSVIPKPLQMTIKKSQNFSLEGRMLIFQNSPWKNHLWRSFSLTIPQSPLGWK